MQKVSLLVGTAAENKLSIILCLILLVAVNSLLPEAMIWCPVDGTLALAIDP